MEKRKATKLTTEEIETFCSQMAVMIKTGIPIFDSLPLLYEDSTKDNVGTAAQLIDTYMNEGNNFAKSVALTGMFPLYVEYLVNIGEVAGKLDEVMEALAKYYERETILKNRIRSAVVYPIVLFAMMSLVIIVLLAKVLPMFQEFYLQLGGDMTSSSALVMRIGLSIGKYGGLCFVIFFLAAILIYVLYQVSPYKAFLRKLALKIPMIKKIHIELETSRFVSAMAMMLSGGINIGEAMRMAGDIIQNSEILEKVKFCCNSMEEGSFDAAKLKESQLFTGIHQKIISIGFQTGTEDQAMEKVSNMYLERVEAVFDHTSSLIEPILVGILSIIVGMILVSVMLPLVGIMSAIG